MWTRNTSICSKPPATGPSGGTVAHTGWTFPPGTPRPIRARRPASRVQGQAVVRQGPVDPGVGLDRHSALRPPSSKEQRTARAPTVNPLPVTWPIAWRQAHLDLALRRLAETPVALDRPHPSGRAGTVTVRSEQQSSSGAVPSACHSEHDATGSPRSTTDTPGHRARERPLRPAGRRVRVWPRLETAEGVLVVGTPPGCLRAGGSRSGHHLPA